MSKDDKTLGDYLRRKLDDVTPDEWTKSALNSMPWGNPIKNGLKPMDVVRDTDWAARRYDPFKRIADELTDLCKVCDQPEGSACKGLCEEDCPRVKVTNVKNDVDHPAHYTAGGIETLDYIRAKLTREEYVGYLRGNILKYASRLGRKDEAKKEAGKLRFYAAELERFLGQDS